MKRVIRFNLIILFCFVFFIIGSEAHAKTLGDLKGELNTLKAKYNANKNEKNMTQAEIDKVQNEIIDTTNKIDQINQEIDRLNKDIEARNQEIAKMNDEIKEIVHYYQVVSSESFYLEFIFKATDFTDFIYRLAISEQLSEYRERKIGDFKKLVEENKKKINEIAEKKVELNNLQEKLKGDKAKLGNKLTGITEAGIGLKDDIASLQKTINLYQNTYKCSDNEDLGACVNRYNRKNSSSGGSSSFGPIPAANGFYKPMSAGYVSAPFGHHDRGLDISVKEGTAVRPVADGVVAAFWPKYPCGGNMLFINHTVNGTSYVSAYFHLWKVNVGIGQKVSHNDIIGVSGGQHKNYAACKNNPNCADVDYNDYDRCTTGPHLHLQLAKGLLYSTYNSFNNASIDPAPYVGY